MAERWYRPFDHDENLPDPPWDPEDPVVRAWDAAHGHDPRLKCYPEYGCQTLWTEWERLTEENERLTEYLEGIAEHDPEDPDTGWRTVGLAEEALALSKHAGQEPSDG